MSDFNLTDSQAACMRKLILSAIENFKDDRDIKSSLITMYMDAFQDASYNEATVSAQNVIDSVALFYNNYRSTQQLHLDFEAQIKSILKDIPEEKKLDILTAVDSYLDSIISPEKISEHIAANENPQALIDSILRKADSAEITDEMLARFLNPSGGERVPLTDSLVLDMDERTFTSLAVMSLYIMSKNGCIPDMQYANIELLSAVICSDYEFTHMMYHAVEGNISEEQYDEYKKRLFFAAVIALVAGAALLGGVYGITVALVGAEITKDFIICFSLLATYAGFYSGAVLVSWRESLNEADIKDEKIYIRNSFDEHITPGLLDSQNQFLIPDTETLSDTAKAENKAAEEEIQNRNPEFKIRN